MLIELTKKEIDDLLELLEAEINLNGNEDDLNPIVKKLQNAKIKKGGRYGSEKEKLMREKGGEDGTNGPF